MRPILVALCLLVAFARPAPAARPLLKKTPVDKAVEKALAFLSNTQNKTDGSWTAQGGKNVAITSLAVMAFLSAGHTPGEGKYGKVVERGVRWVLSTQQPNGLMASNGYQEMYHHGIATLMLCEAAGMMGKEKGKEVRRAVERAVAVILKAQRTQPPHKGGWRYRIQHYDGSDISVTGWQIMALRAARNLGCDIPGGVIARAVAYVKSCQAGSGGFRYMPSAGVTIPCTGTSVLALELCGKDEHRSDAVLRGVAYLVRNENLPRWGGEHFFYGVYYGAQATFQVGENYWKTYSARLHAVLLAYQSSTGAWTGRGTDGRYGANYCTAMAVLALTVEYRYLPIYQRGEEPKDAPRD
jgi:prenyltransferase beta subunit